VFLHMLENPRLCDRGAVEIVSTDESNGRSSSPTASSLGGERKKPAHTEVESPAGDSRNFDPPAQNEMGGRSTSPSLGT
jgi:hypothetical protein